MAAEEIRASDYLADVLRYDATANEETVAKIVKYLGVALRNADSSLVSCGDDKELERVRQKWCGKKLGIAEEARGRRVVELVCETMSAERAKSRVTFYYLVAKHFGKLDAL